MKESLIIVPGEEDNNIIISDLIENTSILEKATFRYKRKQKIGYWIPDEHKSTILNSILDDYSKYRSIEIYEKDKNEQYHLMNPKKLRKLTNRTNHVVDPKLKNSLKNIKEKLKTKHSPAIILRYTYRSQSIKTSMGMEYNTDPFFAKEIDEVIEWAILPLIRFHPGIISDWAIFTRNNEGNIFPVNSKVINKIMHKLIGKEEMERLLKLKMKWKEIKEIVKTNNF
jgi:hypothetical protein